MTTVYGSWVPNSTNNQRMRLRLEYTVPTPAAGATSVTVTGSVYVEAGYSFNDSNNTFSWAGSLLGSGSSAKSINVATNGSQQIHTFSKSVTLTNAAQGHTVAFSLTGIDYVGSSLEASVSATVSIPAKVVNLPAAPTAFSFTRVSDTRHDGTWSATSTTEAPIENFEIEKWRLSTNSWVLWTDSVSGSSRSWSDTTTTADDKIQWRIRSSNSRGVSAWAYSNSVWTTPAAATNVTVEKSGTVDALVKWTNKARDAVNLDLQTRTSSNGGSTWTSWADVSGHTSLSASTTSRVVTGLNGSLLHQYRVVTRVTTPSTLLAYSSASNSLQPLTAPLAPTLVEPQGTLSTSSSINFDWVHNPVDTTAQTAYELQYRVNGGSWVLLTGTTATNHTVAAGGIAAGNIEWQVRTKGQHADFSPWSAIGSFIIAAPPTVSITSPAAGAAITSNKLTLVLNYSDPQGAAMTSWRAEFYNNGVLLETRTGNGSVTSITSTKTFPDLTPISANVQVTSGTGLTSNTATWSGTTDFLEPAPPRLSGVWNEESGQVELSIENITTASPNLNQLANPGFENGSGTVEVWRNRVPNPSFETGTGNVASAAALTLSTTTYSPMIQEGSQALLIDVGAGAGTFTYVMQSIACVAGETIGFRCAIRLSGGPCYIRLRILYYDASNANFATVSGNVLTTTSANSFYELIASEPAPAGTASARVAIYMYGDSAGTIGPANGVRISTDAWLAIAGGVLPSFYFDGGTSYDPDLTPEWVGTAHASESRLMGVGLANVVGPYSGQHVRWRSSSNPYDGLYNARHRITLTASVGLQVGDFAPVSDTTYTMLMKVRPNRTQVAYPRIGGTNGPVQTFYADQWNDVRVTVVASTTGAQGTGLLLASSQHQLGDIWDIDEVAIVLGTFTGTVKDTVPLSLVTGAATTSYNRLERSNDDGETWSEIFSDLPLNAGVGDPGASLNTNVLYRVYAVAALGTEASSYTIAVLTSTRKVVWLSSLDGQLMVKLYYNLRVKMSEPNDVVFEEYFGDTFPTEHFGILDPLKVSLSATLTNPTQLQMLRLLKRQRVIYRDFDGHSMIMAMDSPGLSMDRSIKVLRHISLELTRVTDY